MYNLTKFAPSEGVSTAVFWKLVSDLLLISTFIGDLIVLCKKTQ